MIILMDTEAGIGGNFIVYKCVCAGKNPYLCTMQLQLELPLDHLHNDIISL